MNPFLLLSLERLFGNELTAHSQCGCPGHNVVEGCLLIHTSRGYQRNVGKRRFERPDVALAAEVRAGKYFDEVRPGFPRVDHLGRSHGTCNYENALFQREIHDFPNEPGAGQKFCAGIHTALRRFSIEDRPRSDNHFRDALRQIGNHFDRFRHGHGDLRDRDSRTVQRFRGKACIFRRTYANGGDDANFLDSSANFFLFHGFKSPLAIPAMNRRCGSAPMPRRTRLRFLREVGFEGWQLVPLTGNPHVQRREQDDAHHQVRNETSDDNDGKWPLRVRANTVG